jgi:hypothetical protein
MEQEKRQQTMNDTSKKIQKKLRTKGSPDKKKHGNKNFSNEEFQVLKQKLLYELKQNGPLGTSIETVIELISNYKRKFRLEAGKAGKGNTCKKTAYNIIKSDYEIAAAYWGPDHEKTKKVLANLNQISSIQQQVVQENHSPASPVMPSYEELLRENQVLRTLLHYYQTRYEPHLTVQTDDNFTNLGQSSYQHSIAQSSPSESREGTTFNEASQIDSYGASSTENYTSEEEGQNFEYGFEVPSLGEFQSIGFIQRQPSFNVQDNSNNFFNY